MKIDLLAAIHTYPQGNSDNYVHHIVAVAHYLNADVHALILDVDFPPVSSLFGDALINISALINDAKSRAGERGLAFVAALNLEMNRPGITLKTTEVQCFEGLFGKVVTEHGRYHDIVIIGIDSANSTPQKTAEAAVFGSGRPTLLVPEKSKPAVFEHVMIAWDGSQVATRAVSDARAFLERAKNITIATIIDEKALPESNPGSRLLDYFARHNVNATISHMQGRGSPIADTLQDHARDLGAGLLVMGGFGHSRMRDFVLGGATRGILGDLRLPVIMSH